MHLILRSCGAVSACAVFVALVSGCSGGQGQVVKCPSLKLYAEGDAVTAAIDSSMYGVWSLGDLSYFAADSSGALVHSASAPIGAGPSDRSKIYGEPNNISVEPVPYILAHSKKQYEYRSLSAEYTVPVYINTALVLLRYNLDAGSYWFVCIVSHYSRPDRPGEWRVAYQRSAQESAEWWSGELDSVALSRFLEGQRAIENQFLPDFAGVKGQLLSYEICSREIEELFGAVPTSLLIDSVDVE